MWPHYPGKEAIKKKLSVISQQEAEVGHEEINLSRACKIVALHSYFSLFFKSTHGKSSFRRSLKGAEFGFQRGGRGSTREQEDQSRGFQERGERPWWSGSEGGKDRALGSPWEGGHFHKRYMEGEVQGQVFCGWQRTGGWKEADSTPPSAHGPTLEIPQLTSHTWDEVFSFPASLQCIFLNRGF